MAPLIHAPDAQGEIGRWPAPAGVIHAKAKSKSKYKSKSKSKVKGGERPLTKREVPGLREARRSCAHSTVVIHAGNVQGLSEEHPA